MSKFPDYADIPYINPLTITLRFKTLTSNFNDLGEEKRRRKWLYPKRDITLSYAWISKADARTLWQFYCDRSGAYEAFNFFLHDANINLYEGEYVSTGDSEQLIWNLPSHQAGSVTIYLDGVEQSGSGVDYTFTPQAGADQADKVTFVAAPSDGARITMDFAGILKIRCRFAEDNLSFQEFYNRLTNLGIQLRGILNE